MKLHSSCVAKQKNLWFCKIDFSLTKLSWKSTKTTHKVSLEFYIRRMLRLQLNFLRLPFMSEMRNKLILFKARKNVSFNFLRTILISTFSQYDFMSALISLSFMIIMKSLDTYSPRNSQILFNCPVMFPLFYNSAFSPREFHEPF